MALINKRVVGMVRGLVVIVLLAGISGCSSMRAGDDHERSRLQYEALLWQQAEQVQKQRENILQLQNQYDQLQRQFVQLSSSVNNIPVLAAPSERSQAEGGKPEKVKKRVQVDATGKLILGQVEWAWIDLFGDSVKARLDTGAKSSTLHASEVQIFERDGEGWVRFTVSSAWEGDDQVQDRTFEAPLVRRVKVKANAIDADAIVRRPVVRLTTKVGNIVEDIDFVLQTKANGAFPIVLGRSFIRDIAVVDVAQQYTQIKHTRASIL